MRIFQINASGGGVPKLPVRTALVTALGLDCDNQTNKRVHGGPDRALCLFPLEHIHALQESGHPIYPGAIGENITTVGIDWSLMVPGTQLSLGADVVAEITSFTTPCNTIRESFSDNDFTRILQETNPGWSRVYTRVLQGGSIRAGDLIRIL